MVYLDANNDGIPDGSAITSYTIECWRSVQFCGVIARVEQRVSQNGSLGLSCKFNFE